MGRNIRLFLFFGLVLFVSFATLSFVSATPNGANATRGNSTTSPNSDSAGSDNAIAGNITSVNLYSRTTTQAWQGYYGNVTGTVQLADGSNNVMYNWSQASPKGEVYASSNATVYWSNIQCFNFTAAGNYTAEAGSGGTTSLYGTNISQLHLRFNINSSDADTVNSTFNLLGSGHDAFSTGSAQFSEGECPNTRIYDNTGVGTNDKFEEVLQYEPVSASVVFTAILDQDLLGFDNRPHDFEMLVLEDGHNSDVSTTPYYFFVELQ